MEFYMDCGMKQLERGEKSYWSYPRGEETKNSDDNESEKWRGRDR